MPCARLNLENITTKSRYVSSLHVAVNLAWVVRHVDMHIQNSIIVMICRERVECCGSTIYGTKSTLEGLGRLSRRTGIQAETEE